MSNSVKWESPEIDLGLCVWYPAGGGDSCLALVTAVGYGGIISCALFPTSARQAETKDAVRHISDPDNFKYNTLGNGTWDYTEDRKALNKLMERFFKPAPEQLS